MNREDCDRYFWPAFRRLRKDNSLSFKEAIDYLEGQLGIPIYSEYIQRAPWSDSPIPDDLRELFIRMDSPHWRTILKVYRIQRGLENA